MKFRATVIPSGNATAVEVPEKVVDAFGVGKRPPVVISINGHVWRSRIAAMRGMLLIGISAAHRKASGIAEGDEVEVEVSLDAEPRELTEPPELTAALDKDPAARAAFDRLAYSHRRRHALSVEGAKTPATKDKRVAAVLEEIARSGD
jgi:antitoxin component of MazEF toxin-antitoxin module